MEFSTLLIHNGNETDKATGALSVPVYQASAFDHNTAADGAARYAYSRSGNPTRQALENTIAVLEGGVKGFAFSSGMAAISSVLSIFSAGNHLIVCSDVYGGTLRAARDFFSRFRLEASFVDATNLDEIRAAIKPNTKAVYIETPSNPLLKITNLRAVAGIAQAGGLLTIVDNTFMSPYLQRPLGLGADIVVHSATKFIGGHSDVVGGLAVVKDEILGSRLYAVQNGFGAVLGPQDSWLLLRGLKTLKVRMDCEQKSAAALAEFLSGHRGVEQVYYPGLLSHTGYGIHISQSYGPGAVLSFKTRDVQTAQRLMSRVKLAAVAVSLGGVETIVSYPVEMSHSSVPAAERERQGITDCLIRVSVGLEEPDDLIRDFEQALD